MNSTATIWSPEQQNIFDWFAGHDNGHLVVMALAGTGKTTTILEGLRHTSASNALFSAFNKRIADELTARLKKMGLINATAKTLHAIGLQIVRRNWERIRIGEGQERAISLTEMVVPGRTPDAIRRLITKLHTKGREIVPHATDYGDLTDLMVQFECEPEESWADSGFDPMFVEKRALEAMHLAASQKPVDTGIDFADMIFLPVRNKWALRSHDLVVVDEAQDMTVAQLELAMAVCNGRMCIVGDKHQAIYAFRGADSGSLDRLQAELNASILPLNTTYRCGHAIVREAQRLVPAYTAGPANPEGEVRALPAAKLMDELQPGDFLLSRINAPLVAVAMGLLKKGKRVRVAGRDIGTNLKTLVGKIGSRTTAIPEFLAALDEWVERETTKHIRRFEKAVAESRGAARRSTLESQLERRIEGTNDIAAVLQAIAAESASRVDLERRVLDLFTDDGLGDATLVTCSSVHRSKGLEADRVFVLKDTLREGTDEERNIEYVAITRAKHQLTWVV